jgi:hypothetical protein
MLARFGILPALAIKAGSREPATPSRPTVEKAAVALRRFV